MLFKELLEKYASEVESALDELFINVKQNQRHEQDLLLIIINASYTGFWDFPNKKYAPYSFGPGGWINNADLNQQEFFIFYSHYIELKSRNDYFIDYNENKEKRAMFEFLLQLELMIYLKFWESELMLKRLYQLSVLAQGKNYDWHFALNDRDTPQKMIRKKIRDSIMDTCPKYYQLLKTIYQSQIRNAAAHTQYYIVGQHLGFLNSNPPDAPFTQIDFTIWEEKFHKLFLLYQGISKRMYYLSLEYIEKQKGKHYGLQINIPNISSSSDMSFIKHVNVGRTDWMWYTTWSKYYRDHVQ